MLRGERSRKAANWTRNLIHCLTIWTWAGAPSVEGERQQKGSKLDPQPYAIPNHLDLGWRPLMWRVRCSRKAANWTSNLIQLLTIWTWAGAPDVEEEMQQKGSKLNPQPSTIPDHLDLGWRPLCGGGHATERQQTGPATLYNSWPFGPGLAPPMWRGKCSRKAAN